MSKEKTEGASEYDKVAHRTHRIAVYKAEPGELVTTGAYCPKCGKELEAAYCEERLYAVRCRRCETVTLVKSNNPRKAAESIGRGRAHWKEVEPGSDILFECSCCGRIISSSWGTCSDEDTHGDNGCDPTEEWIYCPTCGSEMNEEAADG